MAAPQGVSVAFGTAALATSPAWSRLDNRDDLAITGWSTRRGRTYITDQVDAGTAQIDFADTHGILDPTNADAPFWPMDPNCPAAIALFNPVTAAWTTIYTGLVQQCPQTMDVSEKVSRGSLMLADLFSLLALDEIPAGLDYTPQTPGDYSATSAANNIGDTTYAAQPVDDRIRAILADAGIDEALTDIFSGNVNLQDIVESAGTKVLAALQMAAEGEFPGVALFYISKSGLITFRGRYVRFNPTDVDYNVGFWKAGDAAAVAADNTRALISGMTFDRDVAKVINAARVSPENIIESQMPGQLVFDGTSIDQFGNRVYDSENLETGDENGDGLNGNDETKAMGQYFVTNMKDARTSITQLVFRWVPTAAANAAHHWAFLCGVEIGDVVTVNTTHPGGGAGGGGGGFVDDYFVEGISYDGKPSGNPLIPDLTMTLDLSPRAYFDDDSMFPGHP